MASLDFFIPELDPLNSATEEAYAALLTEAEKETGHIPVTKRIFKLSFRRDGADIEAEVGKPLDGDTVLAILDLGNRRPYLLQCGGANGATTLVSVEKPVYFVTEFPRA